MALSRARTRVPGAAWPGWVCPAGTVRTGMGICGQCLASDPDGHSRPSRRRPLCSRWMPGRGVDSDGRRLAAASTRRSPGALASNDSPATGYGWRVCPPCPAAGSVGAARRANRVREYHRILSVIWCTIARIWLSCLASHSCQSSLGDSWTFWFDLLIRFRSQENNFPSTHGSKFHTLSLPLPLASLAMSIRVHRRRKKKKS